MGYQADCTIRIGDRTGRGTAWLEHKDLVFRGPFRVSVPLADITDARATQGTLTVRFGGRVAEFDVGAVADRWAKRITNPPSRLDKLGVKPGMRVALVNLRDGDFRSEIERAGAKVLPRAAAGTDVVFLGAAKPSDLARLASLSTFIQPDGAIWVVRPKAPSTRARSLSTGGTPVTERESMAAGKKAGLVDVKVVSFSETHTAEKYVIPRSSRGRKSHAAR